MKKDVTKKNAITTQAEKIEKLRETLDEFIVNWDTFDESFTDAQIDMFMELEAKAMALRAMCRLDLRALLDKSTKKA